MTAHLQPKSHDARFDNIRKFAHDNFVAHDDVWVRFDMLVDQLRIDTTPSRDTMLDELIPIVKRIDDLWDCPKVKTEESCYGGSCCVCIVESAIAELRTAAKVKS